MKMKAILLIAGFFWAINSFAGDNAPKSWKAVLILEGKGKNYVFTSEAVYGGYQPENHKVYLFGKNHMFLNYAEAEAMKVFQDLCVTNSMQQFQFEVLDVPTPGTSYSKKVLAGNISMRKRKPIQATYQSSKGKESSGISVETTGQLSMLGFNLTAEAEKIFTGKYTITFVSSN